MVTVWLPDWPVVAAGFDGNLPAAVMSANRVVARTAAAAAEGVVIGQRRRQAQRRCPEIELVDHDPARDAREFEPVVRAVAEVSPRLDVIEPGWVSLAARGPSKYFGGDAAVAEHLQHVVAEVGMVVLAGVGVADGRFSSSVAARLSVRRDSPVVVEPEQSPAFCASLPIGWLQTLGESDPEMIDLFTRLGLRRLGDLAALDPADVLGRFGHPGVHAHRLAAGADVRPSSTTDPAPERRLDQVLDDPVAQASAVVFVAKQLADELGQSLAATGRVCTRLVVELETEHGERSERSWYRSAGLNAPAMVERVRWQLDAWVNLPRGSEHEITGGIALIRLTPDEVRADVGSQLGLWGGQSEADRQAARTIARLTSMTSDDAVTVPVWNGGRLPADRYRWVPASNVDLDGRARAVSSAGTGSGPSGPWPGALPAPSPSTVFADPHPAEVLDDVGQPVQVSGRGVVSAPPAQFRLMSGDEASGWRPGRTRDIAAWAGPWPIDERWWEPEGHRRLARFQVITEDPAGDQRGYLVVAEHRRWWVAALYD
ncbi:MAG: DNA polymerase Y family protein [Ilumatobacter sp.]|nr:DNA polymerase Y family protein [Ilumatobacter sp.]MBT5276980.1 DNA polymerase Y family protein [Ilumatobacter sp.]MBT5552989.1 DNA polymerase Y family protein [Ilumatobacter sp.]MDG1392027.1 DNA polymerase Y family protein [Ilumatobacter sp.]